MGVFSYLLPIIFNFFPVFIFLLALILLDSFKLLKLQSILLTIFSGAVAALICLLLNQWLIEAYFNDVRVYSRYIAPILEEITKAIPIIFLIKNKKVGFTVDSAIFGFAVGSGFAFVENIFYMQSLDNSHLLLWVVRGLGTAVMHGGTTAIFAIMSRNITERFDSEIFYLYIPGLSMAIFIHSLFNHFLLNPLLMTLVQLIVLPAFIFFTFSQSEKKLRKWLELSLDTEFELLEYITTGNMLDTKVGSYLLALKSKFPAEIVADMLCYMRIYLELALCAKGMLIMREHGYKPTIDDEIREKYNEFRYLDKSIGKTGKLALGTVFRTGTRDLWQLYFLDQKPI
jgi:RsiW-degrading membrane proteinase PrsW (M82 family)